MVKSVLEVSEKFDLIHHGDKILIALSGGADSVALFSVLHSIKEEYNLTLYAAHLNHGLRGEEAERDEKFCKILCKNYNTPFFAKRVNIRELSAKNKISEELCGRNERYAFFEELSSRLNAKIATAHTASDNAETLIFHLARGSALNGAAAIPPKRGNVIRPLIELTRADIEAYCGANGLRYVTDSTNLTDEYTRNKIRHGIIPVLKEMNPEAEKALLRFSQGAAEAAEYIEAQARRVLEKSKTDFGYIAETLAQHDAVIVKTALFVLCRESGVIPESRHIERMRKILNNGGAVELNKMLTAVCRQGIFRLATEGHSCQNEKFCFERDGRRFCVTFDDSLLEKSPVLRHRKSGDSFTFSKRRLTKPLRKALNEMKIPSELRDNLWLLAADSTVLWCECLGYSAFGEEYEKKYHLKIQLI